MSTCGREACGLGKRLLLLGSILQEYDAFTVDELTWIAARHNLVEIAEACRREAGVGKMEPQPFIPTCGSVSC